MYAESPDTVLEYQDFVGVREGGMGLAGPISD